MTDGLAHILMDPVGKFNDGFGDIWLVQTIIPSCFLQKMDWAITIGNKDESVKEYIIIFTGGL